MRLQLAALVVALACTAGPSVRDAMEDQQAGRIEAAEEKLEAIRQSRPGDMEAWEDLVQLYYRQWRLAEDEGRSEDAVRYLSELQDEILEMVETFPENPAPHLWMGVVSVYRNDLDSAIVNFRNARALDPRSGAHYTNLAHTWVYKGKLSRANSLLDKARRYGAHPSELDRIEILAAWRRGDFVEARDVFEMALDVPDFADTWDMVPLPEPMETFEDFANVCCANRACGPNMGDSCKRLEIEVAQRRIDDEAIRAELRLEMERRRRLRDIYRDRGDLEVEVTVEEVPEEE